MMVNTVIASTADVKYYLGIVKNKHARKVVGPLCT